MVEQKVGKKQFEKVYSPNYSRVDHIQKPRIQLKDHIQGGI